MPGSVYKRNDIWWIAFYFKGKQIRTSSKSVRKRDAEKLLAMYLAEVAQGTFTGLKTDKDSISVNEVLDDFERDCEHRGLRNVRKIISRPTLSRVVENFLE
jgi:hypothetical protein